jgi:hypothetical protein
MVSGAAVSAAQATGTAGGSTTALGIGHITVAFVPQPKAFAYDAPQYYTFAYDSGLAIARAWDA